MWRVAVIQVKVTGDISVGLQRQGDGGDLKLLVSQAGRVERLGTAEEWVTGVTDGEEGVAATAGELQGEREG